jgi:hypothetical protein
MGAGAALSGNALPHASMTTTRQTASEAAKAVARAGFRFANLVMIGTPSSKSTKRRKLNHDLIQS